MEPIFIPTEEKIHLINRLSLTGLAKIEVTSFTSPKAIPALADAEQVMRQITRVPSVTYAALVPNIKGCERALSAGTDELNLVMSASTSHSLSNLRMTPAQSLEQFEEIVRITANQAAINVSISTAFGCPFEGIVPIQNVLDLINKLTDLGIKNITLCDTTGMANPRQTAELCAAVKQNWPGLTLTAHFHNTRGMGLGNALAAVDVGVEHFDASLGGLGGCPYAPGASGNVCTEDLVHMFNAMGYDTGVNLSGLLELAQELPALVQHEIPGHIVKAGPSSRRYPLPKGVVLPSTSA